MLLSTDKSRLVLDGNIWNPTILCKQMIKDKYKNLMGHGKYSYDCYQPFRNKSGFGIKYPTLSWYAITELLYIELFCHLTV